MPRSSTPFVVLIAGAAALGGFLFGFDTACINGAVVALLAGRLADRLAGAGPEHPGRVVGVFIGWRGDVAKGSWSWQLSFWNRLLAADRVASLNLKEALHTIMGEAKRNPESRVIMYGHSMGGRILFSAMAEAPVKGSTEAGAAGTALPVDLVVLADPANRAVDVLRSRTCPGATRFA